mmetsp:Transcript_43951/g.140027  ORF Transcript_43951/g.140027 Transcript_43951/m.140027 type:complete len:309 (+) Transcript_43951:654-1580(+)
MQDLGELHHGDRQGSTELDHVPLAVQVMLSPFCPEAVPPRPLRSAVTPRAAMGGVLLCEEVQGSSPDGLEELQVLSHALVQVDADGQRTTRPGDVQEEAAPEEAIQEARRDVCELQLPRKALWQCPIGAGQEDLAKCLSDVVAELLEVMLLVMHEGVRELRHDIGPVGQQVATDVTHALHVAARLLEGGQRIPSNARLHNGVREADHLLDAESELHNDGRGAQGHAGSAHAERRRGTAPQSQRSQAPLLVEEEQGLLGLGICAVLFLLLWRRLDLVALTALAIASLAVGIVTMGCSQRTTQWVRLSSP